MDSVIVVIAKYALFLSLLVSVYVWLRLPRELKWEFAVWAALGGALALGLVKLGGALYYDQRPFVTEHITPLFAHAPDNGFPSDHTAVSMFLAVCVLHYSRRWGIVLVAVSLAIGGARMAAHLHRPIDILGAIAIAVGSALVAYPAAHWLARRWPLPVRPLHGL
jgi:undecaprenyl-diphosphatase